MKEQRFRKFNEREQFNNSRLDETIIEQCPCSVEKEIKKGREGGKERERERAVSYTHLTLPTILLV